MASGSDSDAPETSYIMKDREDATLVGTHCQYEYCNQLDFLPFFCQSCTKTFCLDHRSETAHKCSNAGAWAERKRKAQLSKPSIGQGRTLRDKISEKPCAADCDTIVGTSLTPGVHCDTCNRDYCLKHRFKDDHNCKNLTPLGARPMQIDVAQRTKSALDRLRAWGTAKKEQAGRALPKPKPSSAAARLVAVNNLKKSAKGDDKLAPEKRVYVYVEAEAETAKAKFPKGEFFYSKDWVIGRVLDAAARSLQVQNINNQSSDERDKLRVFHVEGGRLLEFGEKVETALQSGNTLVLLRGVGAPPDLIEPVNRVYQDMPPYVPRKRLRVSTPENAATEDKSASGVKSKASGSRRRTLYDDLDSSHTPGGSDSLLHGLGGDDSDSPLSSLSESDFEDVPIAIQQKKKDIGGVEEDDEDDDIEFEDVEAPQQPMPDVPVPSGDLELTLIRDTRISLTNPFGDKKGPSKRERKVRNATHGVHVLCLLWHNAVRNSWICDPEVQAIMVSHVPPRLWDEVDRWRRNSGLVDSRPTPKVSAKKKRGAKQESRDWGEAAKRLEEGAIDMSHGDPLFRFMKSLVAWWKQRYRVSAPGLRKWGYMSLERLDRLTKAYVDHEDDHEDFGERLKGIDDFRQCAINCKGSRDVGAQLFTALLRSLGVDARMVASLQPLGFGWNKLEDADAEEEENKEDTPAKSTNKKKSGKSPAAEKTIKKKVVDKPKANSTPSRSARSSTKLSTPPTEEAEDDLELEYKDTDDESVDVDLTPKAKSIYTKKFDNDLEYPHYWTEILSPVTKKYLSVDPIVKGTVAVNRDLVETFEPRGAKADRARQVISYVVGYSGDGTAKDVTVRYLKRQTLPGRTKGVRMPLEKIPIYDRHGKVKRYEMMDWFKTALSGYRRGDKKHPLTEVDQQEDAVDLKPAKAEKKEVKEGEETLQYYKQSKDFALQRHLKREEALRRGAEPVKIFKNKGKGGKVEEEDVYLRSDVVLVKSAETWHKQGRAPLAGEEPLKRVPYRAATLNRKREILEAEAMTGKKVLQGLYSFDQTDWIIPPPIKDGVIPKNEYGNIDLFAEHMCPEGAVHVPFRGVGKVCKRLGIDYAEAVVDFEFGHRMAVPVIQGVVIAQEHHDRVMVELEKDEAERVRKEDEKRRKAALGKWRKFLMGMRIVERIRQEYGEIDESVSVFGHSRGKMQADEPPKVHDEEMAGGFLPEGYEEDGEDHRAHETSNFFPSLEEDDHGGDGDLVMEDDGGAATSEAQTETETSMDAKGKKPMTPKGRKPRATRRKKRALDSEDDDVDDAYGDGNDE